mmetsp:Transcript_79017/g.232000  ORF Transcript_79017/g.232000 Transcript_79017/m.232000 type:complete len:247 (-) Transcript_79017:443-1183(-)
MTLLRCRLRAISTACCTKRSCLPTSCGGSAAGGAGSPRAAASTTSAAFHMLCRLCRSMPASERLTPSSAGAGSSAFARLAVAAESSERRHLLLSALMASASFGCEAMDERRRRDWLMRLRRSCKRLPTNSEHASVGVDPDGGVASPSMPSHRVGVIKPARSPVTRGVEMSEPPGTHAEPVAPCEASRSSSSLAMAASMSPASSGSPAPRRRASATLSVSKPYMSSSSQQSSPSSSLSPMLHPCQSA